MKEVLKAIAVGLACSAVAVMLMILVRLYLDHQTPPTSPTSASCIPAEFGQRLAYFGCTDERFGQALGEYRMHHAKVIAVAPNTTTGGMTLGYWVVTE